MSQYNNATKLDTINSNVTMLTRVALESAISDEKWGWVWFGLGCFVLGGVGFGGVEGYIFKHHEKWVGWGELFSSFHTYIIVHLVGMSLEPMG
jgi:hypothetical protein